MQNIFLKSFLSVLNIILPGIGLAGIGKIRLALLTQASLMLITLVICWSRWITRPEGFVVWVLLSGMVILLSTSLCWRNNARIRKSNWTGSAGVLLIIIASLVFFTTQKHWALGVALYFIPSDSMAPTLQPEDVLLVDTWRYRNTSPSYGDILEFKSPTRNRVLVKRVSLWPDGRLWSDNKLYVTGDNGSNSSDSRFFGGISAELFIGRGQYILINLNNQKPGRTLQDLKND